MKPAKLFVFTSLLAFFLGQIALARPNAALTGPNVGGGGNAAGLEFRTLAGEAISEFGKSGLSDATPERVKKLQSALDQATIVAVSSILLNSVGDYQQDSIAQNDPTNMIIRINEDFWNTLTDARVRKALTLHELEGLIGEEGTGVYRISAEYLAFEGFTGAMENAIKPQAPKPLPIYDIHSSSFQVVAIAIDATGHLLPPTADANAGSGEDLSWNDGEKSYGLELYNYVPGTPSMCLARKVKSISADTSRIDSFTTNNVVQTYCWSNGDGKGSVSLASENQQYLTVYTGSDQVSEFDPQNPSAGPITTDEEQFFKDGSSIESIWSGIPHIDGKLNIISNSTVVSLQPLSNSDIAKQINNKILAAVNQFTQQHEQTVKLHQVLNSCLGGASPANCGPKQKQYQSADWPAIKFGTIYSNRLT